MDVDHAFRATARRATPAARACSARARRRRARCSSSSALSALFLRGAVAVAHRQVLERKAEARDQVAVRVVIRRDEHDLARDLAEMEAHEEIAEAVALARDEQRDARPRAEVVHVPLHREALGDRRERRARARRELRVDVELDALEEQAGGRVGVLVGFDDVAARVGDERADGGDDARTRPGTGAGARRARGPIVLGGAQKSVRSGSTSPRRRSRSISTQATPLLSAYTLAWGLICCATNMPTVGANCGIAVEPFLVAQQLVDAGDVADALHLDDDRAPVAVAAQQVDRADVGRELAAHEREVVAERGDRAPRSAAAARPRRRPSRGRDRRRARTSVSCTISCSSMRSVSPFGVRATITPSASSIVHGGFIQLSGL